MGLSKFTKKYQKQGSNHCLDAAQLSIVCQELRCGMPAGLVYVPCLHSSGFNFLGQEIQNIILDDCHVPPLNK